MLNEFYLYYGYCNYSNFLKGNIFNLQNKSSVCAKYGENVMANTIFFAELLLEESESQMHYQISTQ